jgi:hypothetical protein
VSVPDGYTLTTPSFVSLKLENEGGPGQFNVDFGFVASGPHAGPRSMLAPRLNLDTDLSAV